MFSKTNYGLMQVKVLQNAPGEHSAILSTFIKLPFVIKIVVLSIFEWSLQTGFTVYSGQELVLVIWLVDLPSFQMKGTGLKLRVRNRKIYFFISQPKNMLWVLKRTVSMRQFF